MNSIVDGGYADPEACFYEGKYWICVNKSFSAYKDQMNLDVFSFEDLVHLEVRVNIVDMASYPCIHRAVWAPTIIDKDGRYYLVFASNYIQNNDQPGGALCQPYRKDAGGQVHQLRPVYRRPPVQRRRRHDLQVRHPGGICGRSLHAQAQRCVPLHVVGGQLGERDVPCLRQRVGRSAVHQSQGLRDPRIQRHCQRAGHHGYISIPGTDEWRIVYHRRIIGDLERRHRMLCMLTVSTRDDAENLYLAIKMLHSTMGHADIETILDRYTHAQEERLYAVGQLLAGEFKSSDFCYES